MKKTYLLTVLLTCAIFVLSYLPSQAQCGLTPIFTEDFDSYTPGALGPQAAEWTTWSGMEGGAEDGIVSGAIAQSGTQSMVIEGAAGGGPQDVILLLGDSTTGSYLISLSFFIPTGSAGYYNLQHFEMPGEEWANEIQFNTSGSGTVAAGGANAATFEFPHDEWFTMSHVIDLDNDYNYLYVNDTYIFSWPFNWQGGMMSGTKMLGAFDFYAPDATHLYYVDDISYSLIDTPTDAQYCHTATPIDVGTHTVSGLACFGGHDFDEDGDGKSAAWYTYTPTEDGVLSVSSCGSTSDSRVWIFSGGCGNRTIEGINDDQCEQGNGDAYASYREVLVTAGTTYYLVWDNVWDSGGFDFTLAFTAGQGTAGDFCETAIAIDPGVQTTTEINGDASVSGPLIGNFTSSTTPYAQSEWYQFTPDDMGKMTVSSCGLTNEDTRLWIYTGDCGIENLSLVANNDDDSCGFQAIVLNLDVIAGTTYYIEWDEEEEGDGLGFDWELIFDPFVNTIDNLFEPTAEISPNPTSGFVNIKYDFLETTDLTIQLVNNLGQVVQIERIPHTVQGTSSFDVSGLAKGIYHVVFTNGEFNLTRRLLVE
jgi:hypothetical protein